MTDPNAARPIAQPPPMDTRRDWAIAACLGCVLASVYLLTFSGVFHSIDELSFFATTENWVLTRSLEPRLIWFASFHNRIYPFEPGFSLLASGLYAAAWALPAVSQAHAVMLLNPLLTSVNGSILYLLARHLGYGRAAGLSAALAFGLGTMAWPYTKSFLREPVIGLLWTLSFAGLAVCVRRPSWTMAVLTVLPAMLALSVKVTSGVAVPVVAGAVTWSLYRGGKLPLAGLAGLWILGAAGSVGLTLAAMQFRAVTVQSITHVLTSNAFTQSGFGAWYGFLLSPGKSVFIYSPLLVLGVLGWPAFYRRHQLIAVLLLMLTVGILLTVWVTGWTAGLTWGPRYVLPLLPLWVLPMLELLPRRAWALAVAVLSTAYQALVATADWSQAYQVLFDRYPGLNPDFTVGLDWSRWTESPAVEILKLWGRPALDLVWLHAGLAHEIKLDLGLGLALTSAAGMCTLALVAAWRRPRAVPAVGLAMVALAAATGVLMRSAYLNLPDYPSLSGHTARRLAEHLSNHPLSPAAIVNVSSDIGTYGWLGMVKGRMSRTWISPLAMEGYEELLPTAPGGRIAVVMDRPHIFAQDQPDALVTWLNMRTYRLGSEWLDGYEIFHYATALDPGERQPAGITWRTGVTLAEFAVPTSASPGTTLPIEMTFAVLRPDWAQYDRLFTNLVGPGGKVLAGQENWLGHGNAGALHLGAGETAVDRRGLWIPPHAPAGPYTLVVGFSNDDGFVAAHLTDGRFANYVELLKVTVLADS